MLFGIGEDPWVTSDSGRWPELWCPGAWFVVQSHTLARFEASSVIRSHSVLSSQNFLGVQRHRANSPLKLL